MVSTGTRLGPYEIVSSLGSGGMGEVYRARDLKLGREVALKILPETFAADAERLARFQREAQVLASLNHPNIGAIYGLEEGPAEAGGPSQAGAGPANAGHYVRALVLELVDGPTLAERIARGPLPLDEVLPIARQIAEALEAAHEQGIIHRDLKPANIKLRSDGTVKVLDFGLAKLIEPGIANRESGSVGHGLSQSPTITTPAMTMAGVILGTAAYMSPEQAKGRGADKRSDLWAFGCVLFEMLTAKRPFEGEDVSDTLAAVLRGDPIWNALPAEVPAVVRTTLQQCLEKDRRRRIADASTIRVLLSETTMASVAGDVPVPRVARRPLWARAAPFAVVALAAIAVSSVAWWVMRPQPAHPAVVRFTYSLPADQVFTLPFVAEVALSRDGTQIAYVANTRIYLRSMSESAVHPIAGTEAAAEDNWENRSFLLTAARSRFGPGRARWPREFRASVACSNESRQPEGRRSRWPRSIFRSESYGTETPSSWGSEAASCE
jgi:eukaryotic-like serine/threonine-protein kinase